MCASYRLTFYPGDRKASRKGWHNTFVYNTGKSESVSPTLFVCVCVRVWICVWVSGCQTRQTKHLFPVAEVCVISRWVWQIGGFTTATGEPRPPFLYYSWEPGMSRWHAALARHKKHSSEIMGCCSSLLCHQHHSLTAAPSAHCMKAKWMEEIRHIRN